jgi:hypothetical protein
MSATQAERPARLRGWWIVPEHEDVDECRHGRGERHGEDDCKTAEQLSHDRHREGRHERRQPDGLADVRVGDVALELTDDDEPEQGKSGDVQGLRQADGEDEDRPEKRPITGTISIRPTNAPTSSQ